jgi:hypothetical protein
VAERPDESRKPKPFDWSKVSNPALPTYQALRQDLEIKRAAFLGQLAAQLGISVDVASERLSQALDAVVAGGQPYRRMDLDHLLAALTQGRIKSQFETGKSSGYYGPPRRAETEEAVLGTPRNIRKSQRPIYGYLGARDFLGLDAGPERPGAELYGDAVIRLRPPIRDRMTFTIGDSLDHPRDLQADRPGQASPRSYPIQPAGARLTAMQLIRSPADAAENLWRIQNAFHYIEVQYHGGLPVRFIQDVAFPLPPPANVQAALTRRGIPWRVILTPP